jgi:hypothetical protein
LSEINAVVEVDFQDDYCRPASGRFSNQHRAIPMEMPVPLVATRIE